MARGPYAAIAVAIVAVSFSSIFIRWSESDAITIAFYRLAFATLIVLPFAMRDRSRMLRTLPRPVPASVVDGPAAVALFGLAGATGGLAPRGALPREPLLFLAMAVIPQLGGPTLSNWSLRFVTAPVVSVSLVGEPIGSSLLAWLLLNEVPSNLVAVGALLALAGIFLTAYSTAGAASETST